MLALLLVTGMLQQQGPATALQRRQSAAEFDSTTRQVVAVGAGIGDVKSYLDLYRRAVFNGPDEDVITSASALERSCRTLHAAALAAARKVCRHCGAPDVQRALEGYRRVMPSLARAGTSCATRIAGLRAASHRQAALDLRRDVRAIGNALIEAIVPYEQRLQVLRVAAGWAPAAVPPPTPRSNRP